MTAIRHIVTSDGNIFRCTVYLGVKGPYAVGEGGTEAHTR